MNSFIQCNSVSLQFTNFRRRRSIQGIKDLNLSLQDGDRVGLIGPNGAGKSTLLRAIRGVYSPTKGEIRVQGQVRLISDIGVGMEPALSGKSNISLLMDYWGIERQRLAEVEEDVENFTELGSALKQPISSYSNGMMLRLAFALATFSKPEILLIDEIVGVGDQNFQSKSAKRLLGDTTRHGILVLASHSAEILRKYCHRGVVMAHGQVLFDGLIDDALVYWQNYRDTK